MLQITQLYLTLKSKEKYKTLCINNPDIPIFYHPYWLDNVAPSGSWDVILQTDASDSLSAFLVYVKIQKYSRKVISMPPITPFSGILILDNSIEKVESKNKKSVSLVADLINQLPREIIYYNQCFHYSFNNFLPFYWKRYFQTTRYSFVIENLSKWSLKDVAPNIRNKISKASRTLQIVHFDDIELLYEMICTNLAEKNVTLGISKNQLKNLDFELRQREQRLILGAINEAGQICAINYIVYDTKSAYNLLLGSDPKLRQNGAVPFVLYHAIQLSAKRVMTFDFEGSMLESLFDLFAGFGGTLKPYYRIYKAKNIFWDIAYRIKSYYDKSNR